MEVKPGLISRYDPVDAVWVMGILGKQLMGKCKALSVMGISQVVWNQL